jgi:3',5'-cyclic AMP phosphodiesterase CpdA
MNGNNTKRYLVLSDMHFGTEEVSLNDPKVVNALSQYISENKPWEAIIFSGDLLDLNLSTVTRSIEGHESSDKKIMGFREFIQKIITDVGTDSSIKNFIYIPGNHDYWIWNTLSTEVVCLNVLSRGEHMGKKIKAPLMEYKWQGKEAFISGVFPKSIQNSVVVTYPDYVIKSGKGEIVITHGHYIDKWQTEFKNICQSLKNCEDQRETVKNIFKQTAQYQVIANSVSFTSRTRKLINLILGPENIMEKVKKLVKYIFGNASNIAYSSLRNKPIDANQLEFIEYYLKYFRNYKDEPPKYFIFGHTHKQGNASTKNINKSKRLYPDKEIKIFNAGAFLANGNTLATFLTIEINTQQDPKISMMHINKNCMVMTA